MKKTFQYEKSAPFLSHFCNKYRLREGIHKKHRFSQLPRRFYQSCENNFLLIFFDRLFSLNPPV